MGMLVDGQWTGAWKPNDPSQAEGRFVRARSTFRRWVTADGRAGPTGEGGFRAEPDRYHLYVALICPWASRTLIYRKLKGLEPVIDLSVVRPRLTDEGWAFGSGFPGATDDHLFGSRRLHEVYTRAAPDFTGRATVPVLWDTRRQTIVNNESADIIRMFNSAFDGLDGVKADVDFYPEPLRAAIDELNERTYKRLNNGVYRAGFATTQAAYEQAAADVFEELDALEQRLQSAPFLFGQQPLESDWRVFVTLVRFDAAYHGVFKCNRRRLVDYPALWAYARRLYQWPGVAETVNLEHIKAGYYSIKSLNPTGIVPIGPAVDWSAAPETG